jgi:hypothetical protein
LAGAAVVLFAGVLLVPEYARLAKARYELARQQATNADLEALIRGNDRLIAALPGDPVLAKRLAMRQFGLWPKDEVVVLDERGPRQTNPGLVVSDPHPRPVPPTGWLMNAAQRASNPPTRRGLLLLAVAAIAAAIFLFPAKEDRLSRRTSAS